METDETFKQKCHRPTVIISDILCTSFDRISRIPLDPQDKVQTFGFGQTIVMDWGWGWCEARGGERERGEAFLAQVLIESRMRRVQRRKSSWHNTPRTGVFFLKHGSSILRQSYNPVCGFSMMDQVRPCTVCPIENWLGSSINHIQCWMAVWKCYAHAL